MSRPACTPPRLHRRQLLLAAAAAALSGCATRESKMESNQAHELDLDVRWRARMRFWLHLPPGYHAGAERWPLVFFLHGAGERGNDLARVKVHGPPKLAAQGRQFPFILVAPQVAEHDNWNAHELHALLQALKPRLRIDEDRVTVTGLSMGGHGTWNWACTYPDELAAIAPVCGFGDYLRACRMRKVPVRAYHGDADPIVPLAAQQRMVEAARDCGAKVKFIVYPGVGHDAWTPAYEDEELYRWLLAQRRGARS